jgi:hypothetical protein
MIMIERLLPLFSVHFTFIWPIHLSLEAHPLDPTTYARHTGGTDRNDWRKKVYIIPNRSNTNCCAILLWWKTLSSLICYIMSSSWKKSKHFFKNWKSGWNSNISLKLLCLLREARGYRTTLIEKKDHLPK